MFREIEGGRRLEQAFRGGAKIFSGRGGGEMAPLKPLKNLL